MLNDREQQISGLVEKLKRVEAERDELLNEVDVTDEILRETAEQVQRLTEQNKNIAEMYEKALRIATAEMEQAKREIVNRYWQQQKYDKEQAHKEYTEALSQAKKEFSEEY